MRRNIEDDMPKNRFRNVYMIYFGVIVLLLMLLSDPDNGFIQKLPFGASLVATLVLMARAVLYAALFHVTRRGLFDYINFREFLVRALNGNVGAGVGALAIAVAMIPVAMLIVAAVR